MAFENACKMFLGKVVDKQSDLGLFLAVLDSSRWYKRVITKSDIKSGIRSICFVKVVLVGPHANEVSSTRFLFVTFVFLDTCPEKFGRRFCPRNNLSCFHCKSCKSMKVSTVESVIAYSMFSTT